MVILDALYFPCLESQKPRSYLQWIGMGPSFSYDQIFLPCALCLFTPGTRPRCGGLWKGHKWTWPRSSPPSTGWTRKGWKNNGPSYSRGCCSTGAWGAQPACGLEPAGWFNLPFLVQTHQARLGEDGGEGAAAVPESRWSPQRSSAHWRHLPSFLGNVLQKKFCSPFKIRGFPPFFFFFLSSFKARWAPVCHFPLIPKTISMIVYVKTPTGPILGI